MDVITLYVLLVIFVATIIRSSLGFGEALVAVPLLALRIPVATAAPLAVMVSILVAAIVVLQDWQKVEIRSAAWLFAASLAGIPVGLILLTHTDARAIKTALGCIIAGFSIYSLLRPRKLHLHRDRAGALLLTGFVAGLLDGTFGMKGPPIAIYGAMRRWSPQHFRATLQGYFLPASFVGLIGYGVIGLLKWEVARYFLLAAPGVILAVAIGRMVNDRLRGQGFFRAVYLGLIVIGTVLIAQAVAAR